MWRVVIFGSEEDAIRSDPTVFGNQKKAGVEPVEIVSASVVATAFSKIIL
jgi:hypothetical protein